MGFSDKQVRALSRSVPASAIRSRLSAGKALSYIEGWYALSQANRIFGFDGWDRETVETKCLLAREVRGNYMAIYSARVRITVRTNDAVIVRDGHGTGEAHGASAGEVHDRALKAGETDATKRALATFGKAFGLALHAGGRQSQGQPKRDVNAEITGAQAAGGVSVQLSDNVPKRTTPPTVVVVSAPGVQPAEANSESRTTMSGQIQNQELALRPRIEKHTLFLPELRRVRDKDHLRFVASQPCLLCSATPSDAHHIRFAQPRAMARKVGDEFTVPLCRRHHRELHHSGNEAAWWHDMGIEPLEIARELWQETETRSGRVVQAR